MGLDLIDLEFRLEKRFGIRIDPKHWEHLVAGRPKFDVTAAEVCEMVEVRRMEMRRVLRWQPDGSGPMVLGYQPSRSDAVDDEEDAWPGVRDAIAQVLCLKAEAVRPELWLVRDLGFST